MSDSNTPDDNLFDPRQPGKARRIYTVVALLVVLSLIIGIGGWAVWHELF